MDYNPKILIGDTSSNGGVSIVMLVFQGVGENNPLIPTFDPSTSWAIHPKTFLLLYVFYGGQIMAPQSQVLLGSGEKLIDPISIDPNFQVLEHPSCWRVCDFELRDCRSSIFL